MIKGSIVALITPFDSENRIDYNEIDRLLEFHIENKTDGLLLLGTTAEAESLSCDEKLELVKHIVNYLNGRIKVMVGLISNVTDDVIKLGNLFKDVIFDSYLVIAPYYIKSNVSGLLKHFTRIADCVDKPVVLYNVPKRCGFSLDVDIIKILSYHPNIIGIKEASGDISYQSRIASFCNEDFVLYCGDDFSILGSLGVGACGVISVIGNAFPKEIKIIIDSFKKNIDISRATYFMLLPLINVIYLEVSPIWCKYLLYLMGFKTKKYRLPLDEPALQSKREIEEAAYNFFEEE